MDAMIIAAREEEEDLEDEETMMALVTAAIIGGTEVAREIRIKRCHDNRLYLCRSQLLPNPCINTPWQILYDSQNDRAFITTMGFDVETFGYILSSGFAANWYTTAIPCPDTNQVGDPRPGRQSLDAAGALGLVLHYLNSTMRETSLQQIFAIIPSTVSRYITFRLRILLATLKMIPEAKICWPQPEDFEELSDLVVQCHPRLDGAFGSIDGLKLPVQTSNDDEIENATFNGWLSEHFISSVIVFSSQGVIIAVRTNAPGSWHDSRVAQGIYLSLRMKTPGHYYLVADTAFPQGTADIKGHIRAPLKSGQRVRGTQNRWMKQWHSTASCSHTDKQLNGVCVPSRARLEGFIFHWTVMMTIHEVIYSRFVCDCIIFIRSKLVLIRSVRYT
ncbi:hypothetical protein PAXRUDRAFT_806059 [Paxillus rubicundulus Ve08.2h10]|uniref:Unplaced genomic scaffold scaffold_881, whole genome shotgun sequence n=1 Tax=Paxillus rubicundulus Ve08.2h10 TaxID=930991 RepID=A0A0D0D1M4_9AGAM|nr:hypothetical protein PAXRUDRAFT_806059 [Paxillus rubicundulus Ve08.2h10]